MAINFADTNVEYFYLEGASGEPWALPDSDWFIAVKFRVPSGDWPGTNYFPVQVSSGATNSTRINMYGRGDGSSSPNHFSAQYRNFTFSTIAVPGGNTDDGVWRIHTMFRESSAVYHALGGAGETQATNTMTGNPTGSTSEFDVAIGRRYGDSSRLWHGDMAWAVKADFAKNGYEIHDALANGAHPFTVLTNIKCFFDMPTVAGRNAVIGTQPIAESTADMVDVESPLTPLGWPSNVFTPAAAGGGTTPKGVFGLPFNGPFEGAIA